MPKGRQENGLPPNPTGKGGFADNPENINRSGQSSKARLAWMRANEAAAEFAAIQLETHLAEAKIKLDADDKQSIIEMLTPQINALIKQAADRIEGTPKQSIDLSSEDGSMTPKGHSDAVLAALQAKHGKPDAG